MESLEASDREETETDDSITIEGLGDEKTEQVKWDEKARQLMRQIVTQKVELPLSRLIGMIDDGEIVLAPHFQRRLRWNRSQQSRLIESVIMNVPIPPVFLAEDKPGQYVVLDGRQRLTALYEYLSNNFKLSTLNVWNELNGKKFVQLQKIGDPPVATSITRRFIPAVLILHESVPEVKYEVFDRLNTGGVTAEPMEVRNAIYHGRFNALLHEVAEHDAFCTLWGIPTQEQQRKRNAAFRKMADLELSLRFFAFQRYKNFSGSVKSFLNDYMAQRNKEYNEDPDLEQQDKALFERTFSLVLKTLGPYAFHRTSKDNGRSNFPSAPFADAILYAFSKIENEPDANEIERIKTVLSELCVNNAEFEKSITTGTNARTSAQYRIEAATRAVLQLEEAAPIP